MKLVAMIAFGVMLGALAAIGTAAQPKAPSDLKRIQTAYETKLAEAIKSHKAVYLTELEKIERDAMRMNDPAAATVARKERTSHDLGNAPLDNPDNAASPAFAELRRVRTDFERKRDAAIEPLLLWCGTELERVERSFMDRNDPKSAAAIRVEREAVSKPQLKIVRATYGGGRRVDITLALRKAIKFNRLEIAATNRLAGDPAPYQVKGATVTYQVGKGNEETAHFREAGIIKIP